MIIQGDCLEVMANTFPDDHFDAIVTDPPYGLGFMGKAWDSLPPGREWAEECLRVLKPGGHLLAFGGSRTWHRLAAAIEDAGFELRDSIAWLYGSGFPKSMDVSKAIDKQRTEDRGPTDAVRAWLNSRRLAAGYSHDAVNKHFGHASNGGGSSSAWMTNPTSRALPTWEQWQELKGLFGSGDEMDAEVWRLNGRKGTPGEGWTSREIVGQHEQSDPRLQGWAEMQGKERGTAKEKRGTATTEAAQQWQGWGTALKPAFEPIVVARKPIRGTVAANVLEHGTGALNIDGCRIEGDKRSPGFVATLGQVERSNSLSGVKTPRANVDETPGRWPANVILDEDQAAALDESRYFYVAKAPKKERPVVDGVAHPTVKPLSLMRWLVRLVTPPGGHILDPFAGSGATVEAALLEGFKITAIEREPDYIPLIQTRVDRVSGEAA